MTISSRFSIFLPMAFPSHFLKIILRSSSSVIIFLPHTWCILFSLFFFQKAHKGFIQFSSCPSLVLKKFVWLCVLMVRVCGVMGRALGARTHSATCRWGTLTNHFRFVSLGFLMFPCPSLAPYSHPSYEVINVSMIKCLSLAAQRPE